METQMRMFDPKGQKQQEVGENCIMKNFIIYTPPHM
jgi:hypothetical protein